MKQTRAVVDQWESVSTYLDHIAASGTRICGEAQSSIDPGRQDFLGMPLQEFRYQCQEGTLPELAERVDTIESMAAGMLGSIAVGETVRRHQVWSRQGHTVSIHKVLRGDLGRAWRKSVRALEASPAQGRVVLVIPSSVSADVKGVERYWMLVASAGLAEHCYKQGRPVEIWSCGVHTNVFEDAPYKGHNFVNLVCLRRSQDPWDVGTLVLTTYVEWLRRLQFRALEMHQEVQGSIAYNYGSVMSRKDMLAMLQTDWAPAQGIGAATLMLGCTQEDKVTSLDTAKAWVQAQLQALDNVA